MPALNTNIRGYATGPIPCRGAFTAEIAIAPRGLALQGLIDHQYLDSQAMSHRPGMYLKYLPFRHDAVSGQLHMGGAYLFDTAANAHAYDTWTRDDYLVGEPDKNVTFFDQPLFESARRWTWDVVGACNFAPVEEHAVGRFQRWRYTGDAEAALKQGYEALCDGAREQGAAAFWLLHCPDEAMVAIQLAFRRAPGGDQAAAEQSLATVATLPSLDAHFPSALQAEKLVDCTSLFLTLWLPRSRAEGGAELTIPNHPVVPAISHAHK